MNTYFNLPFYNVLTKDEIKTALAGKIESLESMIELLQLHKRVEKGGILAVILESEIRIYSDICQTCKQLLKKVDAQPLEEVFRIEKIFENEIREEVLRILQP